MSLDRSGWVIADGRGRFLAEGEGWVLDPLQAAVFHEMWAAVERAGGAGGLILPWVTAVQVGARLDAVAPEA
ncbi:MAG: hypothetical protein LC623_07400 [Halobacteriales archaeon]|nr:hypothetical protein [Halobacteriales archaeon]